jgi:ABC-2 type transport system permease protein
MNKIWLIIKREYITRVRNRTFIIMTILAPLLIVGFYGVVIFATASQQEKKHTVCVVDQTPLELNNHFKRYNIMKPTSNLRFVFRGKDYFDAVDHLKDGEYQSVLLLPENCLQSPSQIKLIYDERPTPLMKISIDQEVNKMFEKMKMQSLNIDTVYKDEIHTNISVPLINKKYAADPRAEDEEVMHTVRMILAFVFGAGIYMFILLYGVQVFRGVMEEKTNRIVEVIVSSVKPFQLMLGKIIGIALVGLTQFVILITFTTLVTTVITAAFAPTMMEQVNSGSMNSQMMVGDTNVGAVLSNLDQIDLPLNIALFLFYFIFGYLLYASLFAAVGSSVDTEADSQQFMLPLTMPLIFSFAMSFYVVNDPDGPLATILSMIPFTAPIIMPIRVAAGEVQIWQVWLSMAIQVASFFLVVKLAAKIYRTGILMYGKKPTYKELFKWLRYKN